MSSATAASITSSTGTGSGSTAAEDANTRVDHRGAFMCNQGRCGSVLGVSVLVGHLQGCVIAQRPTQTLIKLW